ncbi:MAG TPA: transglycosylase SLT domain-containing protein [Casimicrobiaceae bacterium]
MFAEWRSRLRHFVGIAQAGRWLAMAAVAVAPAAWAAPDLAAVPDSSSPQGLVAQALAYEHGEGVPKDQLKAAALYCEAAREGDNEAQFSLGWMYALGRGVPRDDAVAASLFTLAAAGGHADAQKAMKRVGEERGRLPDCMGSPEPPWVDAESGIYDGPDYFADLPAWKRQIADMVETLAPRYAVDPRLALSVIQVESNFEPRALSPRNARGLMQLIPETAARFNVVNALDVGDNLRGGLAYLRWLLAYYQGQVPLAVAAYNAGEAAVDKYKGIPPYPETRDYVRRVLRLFRSERQPYDARVVDPSPMLLGAGTRP